MFFVPLSVVHIGSFFVFGRILGRGTVLNALASAGVVFGLGILVIILVTAILSIHEALIDSLLVLLMPLYVAALFAPARWIYRLPTVRALGAAFLIGCATIAILFLVQITVGLIGLLVFTPF